MKVLYPNTPKSNLFETGTILWRAVHISHLGEVELSQIDFQITPKGSFCCRVGITGNWLYEPEVYGPEAKGFIIFMQKAPDPNWTHLLVTGCSKRMYEDPRTNPRGEGCALFAEPVTPYEMNDYINFRREMYEEIRNLNGEDSYDNRETICMDTWPASHRINDKRLIYSPKGVQENGIWYPGYTHQTIEP